MRMTMQLNGYKNRLQTSLCLSEFATDCNTDLQYSILSESDWSVMLWTVPCQRRCRVFKYCSFVSVFFFHSNSLCFETYTFCVNPFGRRSSFYCLCCFNTRFLFCSVFAHYRMPVSTHYCHTILFVDCSTDGSLRSILQLNVWVCDPYPILWLPNQSVCHPLHIVLLCVFAYRADALFEPLQSVCQCLPFDFACLLIL